MFKIKMSVDQINYINIGLMIVSAICAFIKPFETFLFVYAFLGPLHYLTEISWLHDKQYFTKRKYDYLLLLGIGVLLTLMNFGYFHLADEEQDRTFQTYGFTAFILIAFGSALIFVTTKAIGRRFLYFIAVVVVSIMVVKSEMVENIFGSFLPTLIHVFIFTGLFILVGALKGRNLSGILSLVVFIAIAFSFFYIHPDKSSYKVDSYVTNSYGVMRPAVNEGIYYHYDKKDKWTPVTDSLTGDVTLVPTSKGFISLNNTIREIFNLHKFGKPNTDEATFVANINKFFYSNPTMLAIMMFIAFAYMYHYLNWFSKTSVIQWHAIPRFRFVIIFLLWFASIGLYMYDYAVGLDWLFFLSFTHVLLEFPLNHLTFINIGKETGKIFSAKKFAKD